MKHIALTFTFLLYLFSNNIYAQKTHTVKGRVVAFKAYPVNNVSITSKKTKIKTTTDSLGNFSIECRKKSDALTFDAWGFNLKSIKIKNQETVKVNLIIIENQNAYKDIIANNHMTQQDLDYCVANLIQENNNYDELPTVFDVIQLVYPNAKVTSVENNDANQTNTFGVSGRQVILNAKGINSIMASPYALLVVDNIVVDDISGIEPIQIATVKVLTGNQADHWGIQGSNGVVEITLKNK